MGSTIFHTSHCGSTLLAYLLAPYAEVYTEPAWTHELIREKKYPKQLSSPEGVIHKYPSGLCHLAPVTLGPKLFLYRNLGEHLIKLRANQDPNYIDYYYEYFQLYCHPLLKELNPQTQLEKHTFLWAHRIFWIQETDVTWVKTSDFLSKPKPTFDKICTVFNISAPETLSLPTFHVKLAGYNHQETPLNEVSPQPALPIVPQQGVIPEAVVENSTMVKEAREWLLARVQVESHLL